MLNPELADERLKAFEVKEYESRMVERIRLLPEDLRAIAFGMTGRNAEGKAWPFGSNHHEKRLTAYKQFNEQNQENAGAILQSLFPTLAPYVETAYRRFWRLPYQTGYSRKAFRAPFAPEATEKARVEWMSFLIGTTCKYEQDIRWFAAWVPYLGYNADGMGILFASVIDSGGPDGDAVYDILVSSAKGEHEIGAMGRHVSRALLVSSRPDGWEFMEKYLLAAQRQEGLRQAVLEAVDEAHPEAFRRMLHLILEHDLIRFSATLRALDVWFGFGYNWETVTPKTATGMVFQTYQFLEDAESRCAAFAGETGQTLYLSLCAQAFEDAMSAIEPAAQLLADPQVERRFIGAHFLSQLHLDAARQAMLPALEDADLRVAWTAYNALRHSHNAIPDLFERLEKLIARLPKRPTELEEIVWSWCKPTVNITEAAGTLNQCLNRRSAKRLIPYLPLMESYARANAAEALAKQKPWDEEIRRTLFTLVGDTQEYVRNKAVEALKTCDVTAEEAQPLEKLLTRKAGSLRRSVLNLLLKQKDEDVLAGAERLMSIANPLMRQAGLELLQQMLQEKRRPQECRNSAERYRANRAKIDDTEANLLNSLLDEEAETPTLENGLGLFDPAQCTPRIPPTLPEQEDTNLLNRLVKTITRRASTKPVELVSEAAVACMNSLQKLVEKNREMPLTIERWDGQKEEMLLGDVQWQFPETKATVPIVEDVSRLPLREVWEKWWEERPAEMRDADGCELLRLLAGFIASNHSYYLDYNKEQTWMKEAGQALFIPMKKEQKNRAVILRIVTWLIRLHPPLESPELLLNAAAVTFLKVPKSELTVETETGNHYTRGWRKNEYLLSWLDALRVSKTLSPQIWQEDYKRRFWRLIHWFDQPDSSLNRMRPNLSEVIEAYHLGEANEADLMDQLIGSRTSQNYWERQFSELRELTRRKPSPLLEQAPILRDMVTRCRDRIIEVELKRGDLPTAASAPATALRSVGGLETLVKLLPVYGREGFVRTGTDSQYSKRDVLSHLIRATFPEANDTLEAFAAQMQAAHISVNRLVELAMYAPQWAKYVEHTLQWPEFTEAIWWIHAHTKDKGWSVDQDVREEWKAQTSERTPLTGESLVEGAVDVAWFRRIYAALGSERWAILDNAAKYASGGGGHKRAQLFADAMMGKLTESELTSRIKVKRNGDAVRALGLLPLPDDASQESAVLGRYKTIQEFLRTSRQFGAQRQSSEKLAAAIGMENLARTAGYIDPVRLQWAMEASAVADLANGPITVSVEGVDVKLSINFLGKPELDVSKQGKSLKSIPPKVKKDTSVIELQERKKDIERQASRMKLSLEGAMCRGDAFTGAELVDLLTHPVLAPMLRSLVFVSDEAAGYPAEGGAALEHHNGSYKVIAKETGLRIAHPYDLMQTQEWHLWQKECFLRERIQPFKQVFRELYVMTPAEQIEGKQSCRYEGHQVNPRQALALIGSRGWVHSYEEGVRKTFHAEGITAWLTFDQYFTTPAEVEGLTVQHVSFTRRGEYKNLELSEVPSRLFSEVMRDVDLVVSVAHAGGVDPEASASTVEMRQALVRETCGWLKIVNVRFNSVHALIDGHLGTYSVHLGSAVVHRQPGGHLCIVPVHGQHRGRLFLPFADDDPKTAEVMSKILMLAKDKEIKDPTILEQILPRG